MSGSKRILIAEGGISGLTAALCLHRASHAMSARPLRRDLSRSHQCVPTSDLEREANAYKKLAGFDISQLQALAQQPQE